MAATAVSAVAHLFLIRNSRAEIVAGAHPMDQCVTSFNEPATLSHTLSKPRCFMRASTSVLHVLRAGNQLQALPSDCGSHSLNLAVDCETANQLLFVALSLIRPPRMCEGSHAPLQPTSCQILTSCTLTGNADWYCKICCKHSWENDTIFRGLQKSPAWLPHDNTIPEQVCLTTHTTKTDDTNR